MHVTSKVRAHLAPVAFGYFWYNIWLMFHYSFYINIFDCLIMQVIVVVFSRLCEIGKVGQLLIGMANED